MTTFFAIFLLLLVLNIALLIFSNSLFNISLTRFRKKINKHSPTKIYPLNRNSSKYKKAI